MHTLELIDEEVGAIRPFVKLELADEEVGAIQSLVKEVASQHGSVEEADFLGSASTYAQELPRRVRAFLNAFRLTEPSGVCVVSGYPIDGFKIGKTPAHWRKGFGGSSTAEEEVFLNLCGALLGDAIAWAHQRDGLICQDLAPIEGHENEMIGSGSELDLVWHTEDARYSSRGDYIGLMCLRNPDAVPTTFASIDEVRLARTESQSCSSRASSSAQTHRTRRTVSGKRRLCCLEIPNLRTYASTRTLWTDQRPKRPGWPWTT